MSDSVPTPCGGPHYALHDKYGVGPRERRCVNCQTPPPDAALPVSDPVAEARKALRCLFIAVDESVAVGVSDRVEAAFAALTAQNAALGVEVERLSDEHHTMAELYEHRHGLFCALVRDNPTAWKSRKHSDGEPCFGGGWFVCGVYLRATGKLVTYHLPDEWWERCQAFEMATAPEWDGHTSADVLDRLKEESAAQMSSLQSQNAALEAERNNWKEEARQYASNADHHERRNAALVAERDALRAQLDAAPVFGEDHED